MAELEEIVKEEAKDPKWLNYEPVSDEDMQHAGPYYTLCEMLREIYRKTTDPEIKMKCRVATSLAKSMAEQITKHYGRKWGRSQYVWNPNIRHQRIKHRELERIKRLEETEGIE